MLIAAQYKVSASALTISGLPTCHKKNTSRVWVCWLRLVGVGYALWLTGCATPPMPANPPDPLQALTKGVEWLLAKQARDGAWRSEHYASFADGTALTPLILLALQKAYDAECRSPDLQRALADGLRFLARFQNEQGEVIEPKDGFDYPVYTASLIVRVLSHPTAQSVAHQQAGWVHYLKERQLTEKLGWRPDDKAYGGWGYCRVIPRKPDPDQFAPPLVESNLSATVFALDALASARALDEATRRAAGIFVRRCQNDDGGFHFIYDDPVRNKAGMASREPLSFYSYGSATADGLRALALCNWPEDQDRIRQAVRWVRHHFDAQSHPGRYAEAHEPQRNAVFYYYVASLVQTYSVCSKWLPDVDAQRGAIAASLAERQHADGSWHNPLSLVREDEPLVATPLAVLALASCLAQAR